MAESVQGLGLKGRTQGMAFGGGTMIGILGGLIGLGGAEFRLPLLISLFRFPALQAVILNKTMSLVVVASALPFRAGAVPLSTVSAHWHIIVNLLAGSLIGSWLGAGWATKMAPITAYKVIAAVLVCIAIISAFGHDFVGGGKPLLNGSAQVVAGVGAGAIIGVVASLLGVAGGELIIPTLVLLFGLDIKLAGSLSLVVSLPTVLVGFARYSKDQSFVVLRQNKSFVVIMAAGSLLGAFIGGRLLGIVPNQLLLPALALILLVSSIKVWRHAHTIRDDSASEQRAV